MEQIKATLSRKVGPFSVGMWLIIVIAGVGLGLAVKRSLGGGVKSEFSGTSQPSSGVSDGLPSTQGVSFSDNPPDFLTRSVFFAEQNRFRQELEDRFGDLLPGTDDGTINMPSGSSDPSNVPTPIGDGGGSSGGQNAEPTTLTYTLRTGDTAENAARFFMTKLGSSANVSLAELTDIVRTTNPILSDQMDHAGETVILAVSGF